MGEFVGSREVEAEAEAFVGAIARVLPLKVFGRSAIVEMRDGGSRHWRQSEWPGFYTEFLVERDVAEVLPVRRGPTFGCTEFDFSYRHTWDIKTHSTNSTNASSWCPGNDLEAVEACIDAKGGLGYIVISGPSEYSDSDPDFRRWHTELKGGKSAYTKAREARGRRSRRLKTTFVPEEILAIWFGSIEDVDRGVHEGWIRGFQKGMRNADGGVRSEKISVDVAAVPGWALATRVSM